MVTFRVFFFCQFTPRLLLEFCSHPDTINDSTELCWGFFWQRKSFVFSTLYWWAGLWNTPEVWSLDPEVQILSKLTLNWLHHSPSWKQRGAKHSEGWQREGKHNPGNFFQGQNRVDLSGSHFVPPTLKFLRQGSWCQADPFRLPSVL